MERPCLAFFVLLAAGALAFGEAPAPEVEKAPSTLKMGYEAEGTYSYVGGAKTGLGHGRTGDVSEQNALLRVLVTPQWGQGPIYRFGLGAQRYSFGLPSNANIPNTLQSTSLILGLDFQLGESWLGRIEVEPGLYSDFRDIDSGDFNAPFIIGLSYIASASVQWVAGVSVDVNRRWPVIPAVGLRWTIGNGVTLNAVLPSPRLEYAWSKPLTLYLGGHVTNVPYRVSEDFGDAHGHPRLNDAIVEYTETRVGAGLTWKPNANVSLELEGGYMPYREFNFHRADYVLRTKDGAPYAQVAFSAKF